MAGLPTLSSERILTRHFLINEFLPDNFLQAHFSYKQVSYDNFLPNNFSWFSSCPIPCQQHQTFNKNEDAPICISISIKLSLICYSFRHQSLPWWDGQLSLNILGTPVLRIRASSWMVSGNLSNSLWSMSSKRFGPQVFFDCLSIPHVILYSSKRDQNVNKFRDTHAGWHSRLNVRDTLDK